MQQDGKDEKMTDDPKKEEEQDTPTTAPARADRYFMPPPKDRNKQFAQPGQEKRG